LRNLHTFLQHYTVKTYQKGDVILQQDATPTSAFIVKTGIVKAYNITQQGEEVPIGFSTQDDPFPLGWIFGKTVTSQYYYEALGDCELYAVPQSELITFIKGDADVLYKLLENSVGEGLQHQMRINALGQSKASDKVLHTIHYFALCFGRDLQKDIVEIALPLTQQDIANFTGLTRETVSVELKNLTAQKIIFSRNRNYIVLTNRLNELLDDEYEHRFVR
jgi:CRP-like cAMP-binding protein